MASSPAAAAGSLQEMVARLQAALTEPNRLAAELPDASDFAFERTLSKPLAKKIDLESLKLLGLVEGLLSWMEPGARKVQLDQDLLREGVYSAVTERVEVVLESCDESIERHLGIGKALQPKVTLSSNNATGPTPGSVKPPLPPHLLHSPNLPRPQLLFPSRTVLPRTVLPVDPLASQTLTAVPWTPILQQKVHALDPASPWSALETITPVPEVSRWHETIRQRHAHPYAAEYQGLAPPASYFVKPAAPIVAEDETTFERTPFKWVGDLRAFESMLEDIHAVGKSGAGKELAVDLEHHDYRSWGGMTCLIQLSTRKADYVIDALDPVLRANLERLNVYFADPAWIKVFHGANSDIIWLQRDFGLYIVGLFDTYHATKLLHYPAHSLASLLERFTHFQADKRYQLADWRIRPIPAEMLHYARSDTHYLLAIYDHLRIALHDYTPSASEAGEPELAAPTTPTERLLYIYTRSIQTSSSVFELPQYDFDTGMNEGGWRSLLRRNRLDREYATALAIPTLPVKTGWGPGELKLELLRALHYWRERVAREEDESCNWVLSNVGLMMLVERNPKSEVDLLGCLSTMRGGVGEVVRRRQTELVAALAAATARVTVGSVTQVVPELAAQEVSSGGDRGVASIEPVVCTSSGLWDDAAASSGISSRITMAASSSVGLLRSAASSLFGKAPTAILEPVAVSAPSSISSKSSSFFGGSSAAKRVDPVLVASTVASPSKGLDAVAKIHASLVLGGGLANSLRNRHVPVAPIIVLAEPTLAPVAVVATVPDNPLSMDHSYVPLSGRLPATASTTTSSASKTKTVKKANDSEVVVVANMADRPKKAKRIRPVSVVLDDAGEVIVASGSGEGVPIKKIKTKKVKAVPAEPLPDHDYSATPSMLDATSAGHLDPTGAGTSKEKKRKDKKAGKVEKGFVLDDGDFRKTPRVNNMPKRGNLAMSFEK